MRVVSPNSSFIYKGKVTDTRIVAKELGVRYILEGSVRTGGDRIRVTAQLVDAKDGSHVWAERYDRRVNDIFDIQDEITKEIVTHLRLLLSDGEVALMFSRGTNSVQAWEYCVRAMDHWIHLNASDYLVAREFAEKAANIDPKYAAAWATIGWTYHWEGRMRRDVDFHSLQTKAASLAEKAMSLDENNP